jgi:nicotinate-nucleotide pyrophosphorylase (carboxylating)
MATDNKHQLIEQFIAAAFAEDIGDGDHTSLACLPPNAQKKARLLVKQNGVVAGVELALQIFNHIDPHLSVEVLIVDGTPIKKGDIVLTVAGAARSILTAERLVLNCMQRMSGVATLTAQYVAAVAGTRAVILDTRKTTPNFRYFEKWAVRLGGGQNHRFGLYDMVMIKDNHHDFCGGIANAIRQTRQYLSDQQRDLRIEVEVRNLSELDEALSVGQIDRIMLDNFDVPMLRQAVERIAQRYETEASGGITLDTIRAVAQTDVDYISVGALTHSYKSLDLSLKAY